MKRIYLFNSRDCTGCRLCELSCSLKKLGAFNPRVAHIRVVKDEEAGKDVPLVCKQCEKAPCMTACPVEALTRDERTHAVVVSEEACIGCGACVEACPFGAIILQPETNIAWKCDLCGGDPECVKYCASAAIQYIDSSELAATRRSDAARRVKEAEAAATAEAETGSSVKREESKV